MYLSHDASLLSFSVRYLNEEAGTISTLAAIRDRLVNNSLLILAVLSLPALAASLARSIQTGWHFALTAHIILVILLWCLVFLRHTLSTSVLGWAMLCFLFAIGITGFLSYGISSEGTLLLVLTVVVAALFFGRRASIVAFIAAEVVLILLAVITSRHWLTFPVNFNRYNAVITTWVLFIIAFGTFVGFMLVIADIYYSALVDALSTAQQRAQQLEVLTCELKEADRGKDQFLMILSHELKTPLTSILGWAQAGLSMPEQSSEALGIIERSAQAQAHILDDIIEVSRLVTGRFIIKRQVTDFWTIAHESVKSAIPTAHSCTLTLHEEPPTEPLPIFADPGRIKQAIDNLLTNAIKFTAPGGQIWVRAYGQDGVAVLEVQDTGRGITPSGLTNLFKPFCQINREEQKGGLGLGLALVKGIVELHEGHVGAASPGEGRGSCFMIKLPMTERVTPGEWG